MIISSDHVESASLSVDKDGYRTERSFLVESTGGLPEGKLYGAMTTAGIPQINDPHPILPDVVVTTLNASPVVAKDGADYIRVVATYSVPKADEDVTDATGTDLLGKSSISVSTGLTNGQTWFDINGDLLRISYKGLQGRTLYQQADVQRPTLTITFKRTETEAPKSAILNYLGKVNSGPWSGFPAKTWLCTKIDASEDNEGKFSVSYGFSYKPDKWELVLVMGLTQAEIDELPPDPDTGNAFGIYDVYETVDFNPLGLNF